MNADKDETGWLIELRGLTPKWYGRVEGDDSLLGWTTDSLSALRFSRREDAQVVIDDIGWTRAFPSEHMWCSQPPRPTTKE